MDNKNIESNNGQLDNKKSSKKYIVIIIILLIVILGMFGYILYDKDIILSDKKENKESTTEKTKSDNTKSKDIKKEESDTEEIKPLDLTKCLNDNNGVTYANPTDVEEDFGLYLKVNSDRKSVAETIDMAKFGPISTSTQWSDSVSTQIIEGFTKKIVSTFVGTLGQDTNGITYFYVMEDGTVEYTPLFVKKTDSAGNMFYALNYVNEYTNDGKISKSYMTTNGVLKDVKGVYKLYSVDAYKGSGAKTVIGVTKDGSFYDLAKAIN